jgi:6-phosphogluconolactonase (cycloisomerase 2 family)
MFAARVRPHGHEFLALLLILSSVGLTQLGCGASKGGTKNPPPNAKQILYLADSGNNVSGWTIQSDGSLTAVSGSPFAVGGTSLAAHPNGKFLFSMGGTSQSSVALNTDTVASGGALSVASTVPDSTLAGSMSINPAGTALYVSSVDAAQGNWGWKTYSIHSDGSVQFVSGEINQVPSELVFTPDGSNAYSGNCYHLGSIIDHYTVASDGTLTFTGDPLPYSYAFGQCIYAIAITPSGSMIASVWANASNQSPADNFILLFGLDSSTHKLQAPGPSSPASGVGRDTVFDASGKFLVVAQDNGVGVYQVGSNSVTEVSGSPFATGTKFTRVKFTPSGGQVVALSREGQQVFVFTFNSSTGALTAAPGSPMSTTTPNDLAIIPQ